MCDYFGIVFARERKIHLGACAESGRGGQAVLISKWSWIELVDLRVHRSQDRMTSHVHVVLLFSEPCLRAFIRSVGR